MTRLTDGSSMGLQWGFGCRGQGFDVGFVSRCPSLKLCGDDICTSSPTKSNAETRSSSLDPCKIKDIQAQVWNKLYCASGLLHWIQPLSVKPRGITRFRRSRSLIPALRPP
eukprot:3694843-Rhodomonas_salina.1